MWAPGTHESTIGHEDDGSLKTAKLKEYTPHLCRILAAGIINAILTRFSDLEPFRQDTELDSDLRPFYVKADPYSPDLIGGLANAIQADFHRD